MSSPVMSPCKVLPSAPSPLLCHDILATIFDHLMLARDDVDGYSSSRETERQTCRNALASSALACSIISHHALNVLWRELDNVSPLLKVLPNYKRVGSQFTLCGAILPEHWTRFQLYADRVLVLLGRSEKREDAIRPSVWLFLAAKCKGSPLMPRLRELFDHDVSIPDVSILVLLISPTLRVVDLWFVLKCDEDSEIAPHAVSSLLHTLPLMAPDLEHLTYDADFNIRRRSVNLGHGHLESFKLHFTRLKTLSIRCAVPLDKHVLQSLSSMSTLQDLSCAIDTRSNSTLTLPRCTFQQLTDLHIEGHLDHLVTFFHVCQLPSLACITLHITEPPIARDPKDSFAAISQRWNPTVLTSISIEIMHSFPSNSSWHPSSLMQHLEPLLAVAAAWPRLARFHVWHVVTPAPYPQPEPSRPTLSALIELAQRCPDLEKFHIPELDARIVPEENTVPLLGHGLRHISVKNINPPVSSKIHVQLATVLDRVFPTIDLESVRSGAEMHMFDGEGWREVLRFLEIMRLGRENGRLYAELRRG
ncbi:hypothetical protein LXA43DRAFT_1183975 [Ganoderma leucocontextum]|nr:hypothetical protein LXA43DRAFT_1183975 [Ganoderma leucocontextum]